LSESGSKADQSHLKLLTTNLVLANTSLVSHSSEVAPVADIGMELINQTLSAETASTTSIHPGTSSSNQSELATKDGPASRTLVVRQLLDDDIEDVAILPERNSTSRELISRNVSEPISHVPAPSSNNSAVNTQTEEDRALQTDVIVTPIQSNTSEASTPAAPSSSVSEVANNTRPLSDQSLLNPVDSNKHNATTETRTVSESVVLKPISSAATDARSPQDSNLQRPASVPLAPNIATSQFTNVTQPNIEPPPSAATVIEQVTPTPEPPQRLSIYAQLGARIDSLARDIKYAELFLDQLSKKLKSFVENTTAESEITSRHIANLTSAVESFPAQLRKFAETWLALLAEQDVSNRVTDLQFQVLTLQEEQQEILEAIKRQSSVLTALCFVMGAAMLTITFFGWKIARSHSKHLETMSRERSSGSVASFYTRTESSVSPSSTPTTPGNCVYPDASIDELQSSPTTMLSDPSRERPLRSCEALRTPRLSSVDLFAALSREPDFATALSNAQLVMRSPCHSADPILLRQEYMDQAVSSSNRGRIHRLPDLVTQAPSPLILKLADETNDGESTDTSSGLVNSAEGAHTYQNSKHEEHSIQKHSNKQDCSPIIPEANDSQHSFLAKRNARDKKRR
jgi:hypothetical protein